MKKNGIASPGDVSGLTRKSTTKSELSERNPAMAMRSNKEVTNSSYITHEKHAPAAATPRRRCPGLPGRKPTPTPSPSKTPPMPQSPQSGSPADSRYAVPQQDGR